MLKVPQLVISSELTIQKVVKREDTALNYGSGKLDDLLATPSLVALMIEAAVKLIDEQLPEDLITVGIMSHVVHEHPTVLGATVSVNVKITEFDGKKVVLEMIACDEVGTIGRGLHERIIVNKKGLLDHAHKRAAKLKSMNY